METVQLYLSVAGLLLLRVGVPIVIMVILGAAINRWQQHRQANIVQHYYSAGDD